MNILHFADITQSDFIVTIVRLSAYIVPFFLIPAAFKAGMGAFSALTGMLNDRSRGFFDKQRKYRQGKYDYNKARMKAGERFNNRGLNALTSRASTKNLGLGRRGRAAYQQRINNAGADFGKSAQAQAVQHNDDALAALTYGSAAEARSMLTRSIADGGFGFSEAKAKEAVAAAQAAGGFGRSRQVWAAQQLAATGTGYENLEQVSKTIARVSHGNTGQAAAIAGNINSTTKGVGRFDLAPGFGKLNGLAQADMNGGASAADYHAATVAAARGVDAVSLLRGKPAQVKQLTQSLADHADAQRLVMNDTTGTYTADQKAQAQDEFLQTMGQIDQLGQNKSYASAENQEHVNALFDDTQKLRTQELDTLLGRTYDSGGRRTDLIKGPNGAVIAGPGVSQAQVNARERYEQTRAPRINPNDPNNQP